MRTTRLSFDGCALVWACLLVALHCPFAVGQSRELSPKERQARVEYFELHIRPALEEHCLECHSQQSDAPGGGLLLEARETARRGGDSGPAVVPFKPNESLLLDAIRYESLEMPPKGKLPDETITRFERWIAEGAVDPRDAPAEPANDAEAIDWTAARDFWAFQPPRRQPLPAVSGGLAAVRGRIDAFVQRRLREQGLPCSEPAPPRVLLRRLWLDVVGLPPSLGAVESFVADDSPGAYEREVERLLGSPHFGERWARLWLDVARYGEDQAHIVGNNKALFYPNAYRYRDWVIDAFNRDIPYDDFLRQQLAADLIDPDDPASHVALGFVGLGPKYYRRGSPEVMADEWDERVDTLTRGVLGLTVSCARCHDHKFDPIPTEDYYALAGVFASTRMFNLPDQGAATDKSGQAKNPEQSMHIVRDGKPRDLPVYLRGDVKNHGPIVPRRFLRVLIGDTPQPFGSGSGRLELANAIADSANPLTARVFVNRVWAELFGAGLVGTPSNFGELGERPTHPDLLDDLARRFMEEGRWSLKWLVRELVLSATYRQTSRGSRASVEADPANVWLSRMRRRRLSVEAWRDLLLTAHGGLPARVHGESFDPLDVQQPRRTLYAGVSRLDLNPLLALFDFPDPNAHAASRALTTTPLQKLFVINSSFMDAQAEKFADRLLADRSWTSRQRVDFAHHVLFARPVSEAEWNLAQEFLGSDADRAAWRLYAHALLASNEALYLD